MRGTIAGEIGEFNLTAQGILAELADLGGFAVQARITGPDLSLSGGLVGVNGLPPVSFAVNLPSSVVTMRCRSTAHASIWVTLIAVQGRIGDLGDLSDSDLAFQASGADLARVPGAGDNLQRFSGPFRHGRHGTAFGQGCDQRAGWWYHAAGEVFCQGAVGDCTGL